MIIFASLVSHSACTQTADEAIALDGGVIATNSWQIGIGLGAGVRTNPLVDGDNIPLVLLPDIAWYGQNLYFDNGELGYQWLETADFSLQTYFTLDRERAFFSFWHPSNIFSPANILGDASVATDGPFDSLPSGSETTESLAPPALSIDDIARRDWAFHAGVGGNWYFEQGLLRLGVEQDVSGTHRGHLVRVSFTHRQKLGEWQLIVSPGLVWKSHQFVDYYYGIDERDSSDLAALYQASSGLQASFNMTLRRPITERWMYLMHAGYQRLHSGMVNSPIVSERSVTSIFAGVAYRY